VSKGQLEGKNAYWSFSGEFTGSHTIAGPKNNILDSPFFYEEVFSPVAQKMQPNSKKLQVLDFNSYGQCKGAHGKGNPREIGCFPIQTRAAATV
jgi:hypothetical protein